ncbi:hypothetical protein L9F63_025393 [Diploptera punctata]|uniref:Replication protein A C-terminal domain-containing protein n=1 Tax=Diploptera punctata TaxID=6984 RepID=A0AAD7ZAE9_DIPPU|nr:hypothetical protein L9F63_025393 [Diploptera punctata]
MFDNDSFNQGGGFMPQGSFASPANQQKSAQRQNNIFPVCVRQILEAPEDGLSFGSTSVQMIELVAIVRKIAVESSNVEYELDDNTGSMSGFYWLQADEKTDEMPTIPPVVENSYYRVYGTIRTLQGRKYVQIIRITALKDLNELTMHLLEVMHKPMLLQKLSNSDSVKVSMADTSMSNSFMSTSNVSTVTGFNPQQQKVYNVILRSRQDIGIHKSEVVKQLEGQMSSREILPVIEFLSTEGHIYSTIDDDHFRCTDN